MFDLNHYKLIIILNQIISIKELWTETGPKLNPRKLTSQNNNSKLNRKAPVLEERPIRKVSLWLELYNKRAAAASMEETVLGAAKSKKSTTKPQQSQIMTSMLTTTKRLSTRPCPTSAPLEFKMRDSRQI